MERPREAESESECTLDHVLSGSEISWRWGIEDVGRRAQRRVLGSPGVKNCGENDGEGPGLMMDKGYSE